ncbi:MAG: outer membrane beta-barrel protein [Lentimicrobiaceae bacterium]|jgi:opacity protein-like surface antigen|nr:outer membrane beta-barrel protein [Lentimicrobiaceae bacterium]
MKRTFAILLSCILCSTLFAQEPQSESFSFWKNWSVNVNMGTNIYHGDINNYEMAPYKKDWASAYGFYLQKQFNPVFGLRGQFLNGKIKGTKDHYGNDNPAYLRSETDIYEYNISAVANFSNWIAPGKPDRKISLYGFAGLGMSNWKAELKNYKTGKIVSSNGTEGNGLGKRTTETVIPVGLGANYHFKDSWSVNVETSIRTVNSDILDAAKGGYKYDTYNYSFLGISYHFKNKEVKPSPEALSMEVLDFSKNTHKPAKTTQIDVNCQLPSQIVPGSTFDVKLTINKGDIFGPAEIHHTLPMGFSWTGFSLTNGLVDFGNQLLTVKWEQLPEDSVISVLYTLKCEQPQPGINNFNGKLFWKSGNTDKVTAFSNTINVIGNVKPTGENDLLSENKKPTTKETFISQVVSDEIEYRVQIMAVREKKTNIDDLAAQYNITVPIKEDYYKGYYIYTIGSFNNYGKAKTYMYETRTDNNVHDAFIVKFRNGKRFAP